MASLGSAITGTSATGAGGQAQEASFGGSAASTGLGITGDILGGIGQYQQFNYKAAVAGRNELYAQQAAGLSLFSGQQTEEQQKLKTGQEVSDATASAAARGVDTQSGSATDITRSISSVGAMDEATQHYNTLRQAYGYDVQAANFAAEESNDKSAATGALVGSLFKAGSSFISGASSLGSMVSGGLASGAVG